MRAETERNVGALTTITGHALDVSDALGAHDLQLTAIEFPADWKLSIVVHDSDMERCYRVALDVTGDLPPNVLSWWDEHTDHDVERSASELSRREKRRLRRYAESRSVRAAATEVLHAAVLLEDPR